MIDCRSCYHLHQCGDTYYCPFAGHQPCIRGMHTTHLPKPVIVRGVEVMPNVEYKKGFDLVESSRREITDEVKAEILKMAAARISTRLIAERLGISSGPVHTTLNEAVKAGKFKIPVPTRKGIDKVPAYRSPKNGISKYDWAGYHDRIFQLYREG